MEPDIVTSLEEEDYNSLWEIANVAFEELKSEENALNPKKDKKITCKHKNICEDVCVDCGVCLYFSNVSREGEWNNYKDDCGNYSKNTQRCDTYVDSNPYSRGGTILPGSINTLMAKLQIQQTFSHKQKTYWLIGLEIERAACCLNINSKDIIDTAKKYWHKYMDSGKLTRASVRKGLIAACLLYSCTTNNSPIERQEIIKAFNCDTKTLSKGEKVLFEILNTNNLTYINVQTEDSNSFIRYCSLLKLKFSVSSICNALHDKHKVPLQAVTPKSAVGGIIAYIVKFKLNLKTPTKTVISATVDVCTPTLNKVIQLIHNLENKDSD
uniref:Transcription factor TFIIB cyclin-like domain-containing protein n=1 Tax=viral metagenome TaxID=1070528 RepID=A0A6C0LG32_9ZZZZ